MITIKTAKIKGQTYRTVHGNDDKIIATIHKRESNLPGKWSVNRTTGRVDYFLTLKDARDDALKG